MQYWTIQDWRWRLPWTKETSLKTFLRFKLFGKQYEFSVRTNKEYFEPIKDFDGTILYSELDFMKAMDKKEGK